MASAMLLACLILAALVLAGCGDGYSRADVRYNLGRDLADDGKYREAAVEFSEAIRLEPAKTEAHFARGVVLLHLGEYEAASTDLTSALRLDPGLAEAYRYRITADMLTNNIDRAFRDSAMLAYLWAGASLTAH